MMAAKDVKMATDNLSCPVCYQLFKKPKYLPCHHSYCVQCLEMIQEQTKIICPECRKEAIVPPGGVKDLDDNFFITRLVDEFILNRKVEGEAEVKCDECSGDDPVVTFCPDCTLFLCHVCNEHHKRSNKSRGHDIVPLTELRSKKHVAIQPKPKAMMCREHDIELLFYCETCDQLVCMYCTVKDHIGHDHDTVKNMVDKHRQELKKITAPVEEMIKGLSDTHDNIEKMRKKIRPQGDEVNKKIDQHYDRVVQKLTKEKKQLKQQIQDTVSQKEKAATTQLSKVEYVQAEALRMKKLKDNLEKSFDQELLSVKKEVIDRMQQTTDKYKKVNLPPVQQVTMEFVCTQEAAFPKLGSLHPPDRPDAHKYIKDDLVDKLLGNQLATHVTKVQTTCGTGMTSTLTTSHSRRTSTSTTQLTPSPTGHGMSTTAMTSKDFIGVTSISTPGVTSTYVTGVQPTCTTGVITTNALPMHTKAARNVVGVKSNTIAARTSPAAHTSPASITRAISTATGVIPTETTKLTSTFGTGKKLTYPTGPVPLTSGGVGVSTPGATGVISTHGTGMLTSTPTSAIYATNTTRVSSPNTTSKSGVKRKRCGKCDGCKAPRCTSCKFCNNPSLKKPCIMKICKNLQE